MGKIPIILYRKVEYFSKIKIFQKSILKSTWKDSE